MPVPAKGYSLAQRPTGTLVFARALERVGRCEQSARMRLGQLAQPRGLVDGLADHCVFETFFGADVAGHDLAGRHTDAGVEVTHFAGKPLGNTARSGQRLIFGTVEVIGSPEDRERRVTFELVDKSVVSVHLLDDDREKPVEDLNDFGR